MPADLQQQRVGKHHVPKEQLLQSSSADLPPPCSQPAGSPCLDLLPLHAEGYKQQPKGFFDLRLCMWQKQQRQGAVLASCICALTSSGIKSKCLGLCQRTKKKKPKQPLLQSSGWEGQVTLQSAVKQFTAHLSKALQILDRIPEIWWLNSSSSSTSKSELHWDGWRGGWQWQRTWTQPSHRHPNGDNSTALFHKGQYIC